MGLVERLCRGAGAVFPAPSYFFALHELYPDHTPRVGACLPVYSDDGVSFPVAPAVP